MGFTKVLERGTHGVKESSGALLENNTDSHEGFKRHGQGTCER